MTIMENIVKGGKMEVMSPARRERMVGGLGQDQE